MSSTQRACVHTQRALSCSWYIHTRWQWREGLPISSRENILQRERVLGIVRQSSMSPAQVVGRVELPAHVCAMAGQINESMSGVPSICLPKLRSVKIQSVTLITQVPSQVCKYDVMCMELRTCHAESFAGLQICESIWSCAPCCTESLAQSASITQECMWGMSHNACGGFLRLPCCTYCTCSPAREN